MKLNEELIDEAYDIYQAKAESDGPPANIVWRPKSYLQKLEIILQDYISDWWSQE